MDFIFQNNRGETLDLWHNENFYLINLEGQTQGNAEISALTFGDLDGDIATNVKAQPRTIPLNLCINPAMNVEDVKRAICRVIKLKQYGTLFWTQNNRTLKISGIVESIDMPRWNNNVVMQISLHCSVPYWEDVDYTEQEIDESIGLHYFTAQDDPSSYMLYFPEEGRALGEYDTSRSRTIYNYGDVAVGMEIEILALDTVTNPIIYGANGFFGVGYGTKTVTLQAGDVLRISTIRGKLSVTKNGTVNLLNYVVPRSTWLQLDTGENGFRIDSSDSDTENMVFTINYKQRYI